MASPNTTVQPKNTLRNSSDGLRIVLPTPAFEGLRIVVSVIKASPDTAGQPKHNLRNSSDGLRIVLPNPAPSAQQMHPNRSAFEITSSPPAESSSGRNHLPYDVFISHRGRDTKGKLASSIYNKLNDNGLRVFLDKPELELRDFFPKVLEEAIAKASLHIAILSENYAESRWCLDELEYMLRTDAIFIPIFYHIEPSIPRLVNEGIGIYAEAFRKYTQKNRYSTKKLQSWKFALQQASHFKGEIINNQCDEEKVVINVVTDVLKKLKKMRLDVAQHRVGLNEAEQDFHKRPLQYVEPIQIVGIWGMGGAGKTTLAKHLYNKKCSTINRSSFLSDIREAAFKGQLHEKQGQLLEDLNLKAGNANFYNIDLGKEILRNRLRSPVLIVLDDVDHIDQLNALLPARDSLGHGSLIIVTTRELHVLEAWDISDRYQIRPLNDYYAEELFCWHAFGQPSPFIDFKALAKKFTDACRGLPLSLKVLGSLLHGKSSKQYWQAQLDKLSRILPQDIKSRLKISYDALDNEEKEMFLDVACFFIGWPSSRAIGVWDGSEWSGLIGWETLVNKCLVELDEYDNMIRMHDHLRDLGREIANKQSPYRLCSERQIIEIQPQQEAIRIRGILTDAFGDNCYPGDGKMILNTSQGERTLAPGSIGLKIFIGDGDFINEEYGELSRELLCFICAGFAHKNLPSWFPLKKLRILCLCEAEELEDDLWECDEDAPLQLRQLDIIEGYVLKKISGLQRLRSLETLSIEWCTELKTLPSLAGLTSLKEIKLRWCQQLEKIEGLEGMRSLETLKIINCTELKTLPSLAGLTSLEKFKLRGCHKVDKVEGLEVLTSLKKVAVHMWSMRACMLKLPEQSERLKSMEVVANRIGVVEPSIREIQKWPRKEIICTRAVIDEMSLRNFFTSLRENVVKTYSSEYVPMWMWHGGALRLRMPENAGNGNGNAILICFIIHSTHRYVPLKISTDTINNFSTSMMSNGESIWVWMGIFPQQSEWLHSERYYIKDESEEKVIKEAWMLRGTEQSIREDFRRLSQS